MQNRQVELAGGGLSGKVFHSIFEGIISLENLFFAWDDFKDGKRKKRDVQEFGYNLEENIFQLHSELKTKTYEHSDYTAFYVRDPKLRRINKACVKDRILHHAVFRIFYHVFDKIFIFDSYSCRIEKGTHRAINRLNKFARKASKNNTRACYALKCDIRKFFDSIDQNILIGLVKNEIKNADAVWLVEKIIKSFSTAPGKGLPLGNITSQLFANIYLNELDRFAKHELKVKYYLRYSDDFLIISENREYLEKIIPEISRLLNEKLKLSLHSDKIIIRKWSQGVDFLGYVSFPRHRILRTKTKRRVFKKIETLARQVKDNKISEKSFNQSLQSYLGMLKHCNAYGVKKELEALISKVNRDST